MINFQKHMHILFILSFSTMLSSCISLTRELPKNELINISSLSLESTSTSPEKNKKVLLIDEIDTSGILNTDKIIIVKTPHHYDFFAGYLWSEKAPDMLYFALKESFENRNIIETISYEDNALNPDYILKLNLRDFQVEYSDKALSLPPKINTKIYATLIKMPGRNVYMSKTFEELRHSPENKIASIIATFDKSFAHIQEEIIAWAYEYAD